MELFFSYVRHYHLSKGGRFGQRFMFLMQPKFLFCLPLLLLLGFPNLNFGQAPPLGTTADFALFTAVGAFNNTGATVVTGDIGTNVGAFTGFPPGVVIGMIHVADVISAQAATDVAIAYASLASQTCGVVLGIGLGNDQILTPNIYCTGAATTLTGNLILDAEGDPNALFIFQFDGAFSTSTISTITLTNGASTCNVFWQVNGAFNLASNSLFRGTLIASGAIDISIGSTIFGRALSTGGAISISESIVTVPCNNAMPPTITCPTNLVMECADGADYVAQINNWLTSATATVDCGDVIITNDYDNITVPSLSCNQTSGLIITFTATDECGTTGTCTGIIYLDDSQNPIISSPQGADIDIGCNPTALLIENTFFAPVFIDNCAAPIVTIATVHTSTGCLQSDTRTWIATDACGNDSSASQTVSYSVDAQAPTVSVPEGADVDLGCNPTSMEIEDTFEAPEFTDDCTNLTTIAVTDTLIIGCLESHTRTWTATDACGNEANASQTVSFSIDTQVPTTSVPAGTNVDLGCNPTSMEIEDAFEAPEFTDDCTNLTIIAVTDTLIIGCLESHIRTWTATDACGNEVSDFQTVSFSIDTQAPTILTLAGSDINLGCNPTLAEIEGAFETPEFTDDCGNFSVISMTDTLIVGCLESHLRIWTATDACNNSTSTSQLVTYRVDTQAPTITSLQGANVTIECNPTTPQIESEYISPVFADNCLTPIVLITNLHNGADCLQSDTRTWTATDACGNSTSVSQTVTYNVDIQAPTASNPPTVNVQCIDDIPDANIIVVTDEADNCEASPIVILLSQTNNNGAGCTNSPFVVTRIYRISDACGNFIDVTQSLIAIDDIAPMSITCPDNITVQCVAEIPVPDPTSIISNNNCSGVIVVLESEVVTNLSCVNQFTLTRTYRASDACGNSTTCAQVITVFDDTPPVILLPQGLLNGETIQVQCYGQNPEWIIPEFDSTYVSALDNCSSNVTVQYNLTLISEGTCADDGYIILNEMRWTATDDCGNSSTAFIYLSLVDTIAPVIEGVPEDVSINCNEMPALPSVFATDECLCACVIAFQESGFEELGCQNGRVVTRSWTATDRCGNVTTAVQHITLIDAEGPELKLIQPELANLMNGTILEYTCNDGGIPSFFDGLNESSMYSPLACGSLPIITFSQVGQTPRNCESYGYIEERTYEWVAVDLCGNKTSFSIVVHLIDDEPPVLLGVPEMTCLGDPALNNIEAVDNCGHASVRFWDVAIPDPCGNGTALRRTYEGFDPCGNMVRDTAILITNNNPSLSLTFNNPEIWVPTDGETININCEFNTDHMTGFDVDDVIVTGGCMEEVSIGFEEKLLQTGDCLTDGFIAIMQLQWTATDICGNISQLIVLVKVVDETTPVFHNFNSEVTIGCQDPMPKTNVTDNCGKVNITEQDSIINGPCPFEYVVIRSITATDACGNSSTRLQTVHVGDGKGPVIEGVVKELCDDLTIPIVTAFDECAGLYVEVTMKQDTLDVPCRDGLVIQRIWSATDVCGHTTVIYQIIIINDTTPPLIQVPTYSVILDFLDTRDSLVYLTQKDVIEKLNVLDESSVSAIDNCDADIIPVLILETTYAENCEVQGYYERRIYTWFATDICGNYDSIQIIVLIVDDIPPVWLDVPNDTTIICEPLPDVQDVSAIDPAQAVLISYSETIVPGLESGVYLVTRTWTATDACDNISTVTQHITWIPDTFLECTIILPDIECNSHGNIITGIITGGNGPFTYNWEVTGENCFIQGDDGTPDVIVYMGWTDVKLVLTVTDSSGCVSICTAILHCLDVPGGVYEIISPQTNLLSNPEITQPSVILGTTYDRNQIEKIKLWPNPARDFINLSFESAKVEEIKFAITNLFGQQILSEKINTIKGLNEKKFNVSQLPEGSYLITVKSQLDIHTEVIVLIPN